MVDDLSHTNTSDAHRSPLDRGLIRLMVTHPVFQQSAANPHPQNKHRSSGRQSWRRCHPLLSEIEPYEKIEGLLHKKFRRLSQPHSQTFHSRVGDTQPSLPCPILEPHS